MYIWSCCRDGEGNNTRETQQKIDQLKEDKKNTGEINTKSGKWFGRQKVTKELLETNKEFIKYYIKFLMEFKEE
ncbi:hypothetical protein [Clostridioides difficile]|uniref:hypothetical protein n=1 Tax=Clostridioides difficile TaxID=1496 RepID=UPI001F349ADF|nr:hypothetical protein [Clostridioides difficile]